MIAHRILRSLSFRCRRFAADRRGVSAVEFALLLPLMLTMYFGSIQITDAISADRQVTLVASTVAEIASQYSQVTTTDLTNILNAAGNVFTPFPMQNGSTTVGTITLTSVTIDATGKATVDWSQSLYGTKRAVGAVVTSSIPAGLLSATPGSVSSVIWGEATYSYKPVVGWVVTGTVPMYDQIFLRPRQSNSICLVGTNC
jgi:Flp pilus assembly protein TadG